MARTKKVKKVKTPLEQARAEQAKQEKRLRKRARLLPAIECYDAAIEAARAAGSRQPEVDAMATITSILRGTYADVKAQIAAAGKTGIGEQNAIKRSAGTNFQGLCEYAILKWLATTSLPVSVQPNAPKDLREELTIHGIDTGGPFSVEPDIDLCLWEVGGGEDSPVLFVSAKTSLVDRAGQAARWKLYLDLHQTTCRYTTIVKDCPIHRTNVRMKTKRPIHHSIVTANIYKIDTTHPQGELENGQCRNNTYMFKHRYTTRNDSAEVRPAGWESFSKFPQLVRSIFSPALPSPGTATALAPT